jgi:hypothetical protein
MADERGRDRDTAPAASGAEGDDAEEIIRKTSTVDDGLNG